jgi:solute carrier family 10 (sodium/bile acid cotransporter), member 7
MLKRLIPDSFILILLATIVVARFVPVGDVALAGLGMLSNAAIFSLFFFHGLRLAHARVWEGLKHWQLQLAALGVSFCIVPLLGLGLSIAVPSLLSPALWLGIFFLCVLPSTVQSAIASSSMAGGNVAGSVIASALSNLLGVALTPMLFSLFAKISGVDSAGSGAITKVATLLLLPFLLGQAAQWRLAEWAERHRDWIGRMDRSTIVLTVFVTFSIATREGLWTRLSAREIVALFAVIALVQVMAFAGSWWLGGRLNFSRADRITLFYAGAHKSLATGAPMARILFPAAQAGLILIPLMLYHQVQLIVSPWLAARLAEDGGKSHDTA